MPPVNPILLSLDRAMPAQRQVMWRRAMQEGAEPLTTEDPSVQPSLVICAADRWSDAFLASVHDTLQRHPMPVVVAVCEAPEPHRVRALVQAGVWNVMATNDPQALRTAVIECATRLRDVEAALGSPVVRNHLVGTSAAWRAFLRELIWATKYSSASMLLHGETGTGKELLSRLVHTLDLREDKGDLVVVDCTTLSPELAASELFGHERGAFTGAQGPRAGAAALADRGTLFLDEVGELGLPVQAQLLRLLQEGSYKAVGGNTWKHSRFRLVCATHRDLREAVAAGRFRQDLYFRISGWTAVVPALRERPEDIPHIANHFLREFGCEHGVDETVARSLMAYPFDGNVRELRQLMMQSAVKHCGKTSVSLADLPQWWHRQVCEDALAAPDEAGAADVSAPDALIRQWVREGMGLREITQRAGDVAIREALVLERQQVGKAARRLGITERAIQLRKAQRPEVS